MNWYEMWVEVRKRIAGLELIYARQQRKLVRFLETGEEEEVRK